MRASVARGLLALLSLSQVVPASASDKFTLRLPRRMPEWAEKLSPYLAGFSIEMDRWPEWAGEKVGEPNEYFNQVLQNLGDRTGHMPFLRVGANSQDRATVDLEVEVMNATFPEPTEAVPKPEADRIFIGRDFYALSSNLPAGTPFMWGINLKALNRSETVAQACLLADTFQGYRANLTKHVRLANVEIGNEPDFYGPNRKYSFQGTFGSEWDIHNYTDTWTDYAQAIGDVINFDSGGPSLSVGSYTGFNYPDWSVTGTLMGGLLDDDRVWSRTNQFALHGYLGGFGPGLRFVPGELMYKDTIRSNLTSKIPNISALRALGRKAILGETNSYANHGIPGLSNTVESAIWAVDWLLLAASSGVERLHFHHGIGFRYNTVQPVADADDGLNITRPHILPSYHAFLIVNEAIGTSRNAYVAEVPSLTPNLTAYGVWEGHQLARLVVLNSQVYLGEGEKPTINVTLDGFSAESTATMRLLRSETTTAMSGLTWAGQNFETASGKPQGEVQEDLVRGGRFTLPASSIALLSFGNNSIRD